MLYVIKVKSNKAVPVLVKTIWSPNRVLLNEYLEDEQKEFADYFGIKKDDVEVYENDGITLPNKVNLSFEKEWNSGKSRVITLSSTSV